MICESKLATKLLKNYLSQKYSWFLDKNTADLKKKILSEEFAYKINNDTNDKFLNWLLN
jgi:hypothetical protein